MESLTPQGSSVRNFEHWLGPLDRLFNWVYTARYNPLYQSGALTVGLFLVMLVTGIYLLIFYKTGAPYDSVAWMQSQVWHGRWIRSLHRYASNAAMVAAMFHMLRVFLQGRTWGPRVMAWLSGVALLGVMLICGWTGLILVWDVQAQWLAVEGAKLMDLLPLFSEPISRAFVSEKSLSASFFFMNMVAHIAIPIALALLIWIHTMRLARPRLLPEKRLFWGMTGGLIVLSIVAPVDLPPRAEVFSMVGEMPIDLMYSFWLLLTEVVSTPWVMGMFVVTGAGLASVPLWRRPSRKQAPIPSFVQEPLCTGCTQCYKDCPYEAIQMVPRELGKGSDLVGRVNPDLCVSCGICVGSCAPMMVGPPGRQGRSQLDLLKATLGEQKLKPGQVMLFHCANSAGTWLQGNPPAGVVPFQVNCAGELHTSLIEYVLRRGAGGAYVLSCPSRDCVYREGPNWLFERVYKDREAELQPRVDRRRVRLGFFNQGESTRANRDIKSFIQYVQGGLKAPVAEQEVELDLACDLSETGND